MPNMRAMWTAEPSPSASVPRRRANVLGAAGDAVPLKIRMQARVLAAVAPVYGVGRADASRRHVQAALSC